MFGLKSAVQKLRKLRAYMKLTLNAAQCNICLTFGSGAERDVGQAVSSGHCFSDL